MTKIAAPRGTGEYVVMSAAERLAQVGITEQHDWHSEGISIQQLLDAGFHGLAAAGVILVGGKILALEHQGKDALCPYDGCWGVMGETSQTDGKKVETPYETLRRAFREELDIHEPSRQGILAGPVLPLVITKNGNHPMLVCVAALPAPPTIVDITPNTDEVRSVAPMSFEQLEAHDKQRPGVVQLLGHTLVRAAFWPTHLRQLPKEWHTSHTESVADMRPGRKDWDQICTSRSPAQNLV